MDRLTVTAIKARIPRLDMLTMGLSPELLLLKEGDDHLLYLERVAYRNSLDATVRGLEAARVVL